MPFVKYFIVPYTTAYAYWVIGPFLIYGFMGRKKFYQFILSSIVVNILSVVIFITIPNGIAANFRPVITEQDANKDFFLHMCNWTFTTDSFDQTFPSGHICLSVLIVITFRGTYFKNGVKRLTRTVAWCSLIYALLICTSTLFVKQHYIFDVYVSIFLCEIFMLLFLKWNFLTDKLENFMHWFNSRLGLINDEKNKPFTKYSQKAVLVWIVWLLWIAFTFWAFWETQWFIEEFLLNIGTMLVWVVITFFYYFFRMMKHENQKIN
ncbi:MAG: phosphatase PAP2 family protein [Mycoplasmataceae bacterium]|nr:phosphatase PAP2 family protein [Mycoplasmataceae bacterium]